MTVRRDDFREVRPTPEELAALRTATVRRYGEGYAERMRIPVRAEHKPCGKRIWYSGIGIGSHMRACPRSNVRWVIETYPGDGTVEWWSNDLGWVEKESQATEYTDDERYNLRLPLDGQWVERGGER